MGRAPCCEKVGLKRGRWTAEEDEILINYIKQNGDGSWRSLPKNAGLLRCGKSCRLRWINYLRDDLKRGNFTRDEEETIIKLHKTVGNKWSLIASNLPGRTDNEVKNYWNSHLSRKIYSFRSSSNGSMVTTIDMVKMAAASKSSTKRKGGRVSRAVAKKYNMNAVSSKDTTTTTAVSSSALRSSKPRTITGSSIRAGIQEATAAEVVVAGKGNGGDELSNNVVTVDDKVEREGSVNITNNIDDFNCNGLLGGWCESFLEMMEQEHEVLGPDNWGEEPRADDVSTLLLEQFLQGDLVMDFSEIEMHNSSSEGEETTGKSYMMMDHLESPSAVTVSDINIESDNGRANSSASSADTNGGDLYECFSPLNTTDNDTLPWDKEYPVKEFQLWDGVDDLIWP